MSDPTREKLLQDRQRRGEAQQAVTETDFFESVKFRAVVARQFYQELIACGFSEQDAVLITAGQSF